MQKDNYSEINPEVLYLSEDSKTGSEEENVRNENEEFGVDAKALVDSRIYERPSYRGKRLGIKGNVVVADSIEDLSSGIVFSKK